MCSRRSRSQRAKPLRCDRAAMLQNWRERASWRPVIAVNRVRAWGPGVRSRRARRRSFSADVVPRQPARGLGAWPRPPAPQPLKAWCLLVNPARCRSRRRPPWRAPAGVSSPSSTADGRWQRRRGVPRAAASVPREAPHPVPISPISARCSRHESSNAYSSSLEAPMPSFAHLPKASFRALVRFQPLLRCSGPSRGLVPRGC